jgi:hypothetical protein
MSAVRKTPANDTARILEGYIGKLTETVDQKLLAAVCPEGPLADAQFSGMVERVLAGQKAYGRIDTDMTCLLLSLSKTFNVPTGAWVVTFTNLIRHPVSIAREEGNTAIEDLPYASININPHAFAGFGEREARKTFFRHLLATFLRLPDKAAVERENQAIAEENAAIAADMGGEIHGMEDVPKKLKKFKRFNPSFNNTEYIERVRAFGLTAGPKHGPVEADPDSPTFGRIFDAVDPILRELSIPFKNLKPIKEASEPKPPTERREYKCQCCNSRVVLYVPENFKVEDFLVQCCKTPMLNMTVKKAEEAALAPVKDAYTHLTRRIGKEIAGRVQAFDLPEELKEAMAERMSTEAERVLKANAERLQAGDYNSPLHMVNERLDQIAEEYRQKRPAGITLAEATA